MPRSVSASSNASDWALMRNSTAISRSGVPASRSRATCVGDGVGLGHLVGASRQVTTGPAGALRAQLHAAGAGAARAARWRSSTTCGVER